jgi:hypothetical protein
MKARRDEGIARASEGTRDVVVRVWRLEFMVMSFEKVKGSEGERFQADAKKSI